MPDVGGADRAGRSRGPAVPGSRWPARPRDRRGARAVMAGSRWSGTGPPWRIPARRRTASEVCPCWTRPRSRAGTGPGTRELRSAGRAGRARQRRDEVLGVGAAPSGDRVPTGCCVVADEDPGGPQYRVVAGDHVVEGPVRGGATGDVVEGGVDEAEVVAGLLVGQCDHARPQRGGGTGAAGRPEFAAGVLDRHGGGRVPVGGHVGDATGGTGPGDAVLVGGPGKQAAVAAP